jgi:hypothetical protein
MHEKDSNMHEKDSGLDFKPYKIILNYKSEQHTCQEAGRCFITKCVKLQKLQCSAQLGFLCLSQSV